MSIFRNLLTGLLTALASILIVVGALSVSVTEGIKFTLPTPAPADTGTPTPTSAVQILATGSGPTALPTPTAQPSATATATFFAPTACPIPQGWTEYEVEPGDNLADLAEQYGLSTARLMKANCLVTESLLTGTLLYVPPLPAVTTPVFFPTPTVSCGHPWDWVQYIVRPGDTLFNLSLIYGVSVLELQYSNCLADSTIRIGQALWVPNVPTRTPDYSATPRITATPTLTKIPPTPPPTATVPTPAVSTATATAAPSSTPVPTVTETAPAGSVATDTGASLPTPAVDVTPANP